MNDGILIIGCGSIGMRHISNLRVLNIGKIFAFDPILSRLDKARSTYNILPCRSVEDSLNRKPGIVFICTPPTFHIALAQQSVEAGCHVFIEKPLANIMDGVDELLINAVKQNLIVYVGYNLRFHEGIACLKKMLDENKIGNVMSIRAEFGQYLPDWRPTLDYRQTYTANASLGGGIILDGSHEFDYVRWIGGEVKTVNCTSGQVSNLDMDVEDIAEINLTMQGGIIAQVHLDCIQRGYSRNCKVLGDKGTIIWDVKTGIHYYNAGEDSWYNEMITQDTNKMYLEEIRHFLACTRGDTEPLVDGATGRRVLEIALAAIRSSDENRVVAL